jgi:hypothetical protein
MQPPIKDIYTLPYQISVGYIGRNSYLLQEQLNMNEKIYIDIEIVIFKRSWILLILSLFLFYQSFDLFVNLLICKVQEYSNRHIWMHPTYFAIELLSKRLIKLLLFILMLELFICSFKCLMLLWSENVLLLHFWLLSVMS